VASKILLVFEEYSELMVAQTTLQKVGYDVLAITTEYTVGENILSFNPDVVVGCGKNGKVTTMGVGRRLREMTRWQGKGILIFPAGYQPSAQDFAKIRGDVLLEAPIPGVRLLQVIAKLVGDDEAMLLDRLSKQSTSDFSVDQGPVLVDSLPAAPKNLDAESNPSSPKAGGPDLESLWKELTEGAKPAADPASAQTPAAGLKTELSALEDPEAKTAAFEARPSISFDLKERESELNEHELEELAEELQRVKKTERERVARYAKITAKMEQTTGIPQGFSKVKSRIVQKELVKSWNPEDIARQDHERREFTKALFRKK
jgi:hypothetical protein